MDIQIRSAVRDDAPTIAEFNALMAQETEELTLDPVRLRAGVDAVIREPELGVYYVATSGGRVVGQLMVTYEWSDWRNGMFWWIQSVYVRKEFRGMRVFTELYRHVERLAREDEGVCGLRLYVEEKNERAQQTYRALGMHTSKYRMMETDFVL